VTITLWIELVTIKKEIQKIIVLPFLIRHFNLFRAAKKIIYTLIIIEVSDPGFE
jgi:hypothetical protein